MVAVETGRGNGSTPRHAGQPPMGRVLETTSRVTTTFSYTRKIAHIPKDSSTTLDSGLREQISPNY